MSGRDKKQSEVHQQIEGDYNQVAGHNIINNNAPEEFRPDPSDPNYMSCSCGKTGLALNADRCPRCKRNFQEEREQAFIKRQEDNKQFRTVIAYLFIIAISGGIHISSQTKLDLFESIALMALILGGLWFGWIWIQVKYEFWRASRTKK